MFKTVSLAIILSLTLLATFPANISSVRALSQSGQTTWSPFGPREKNLIITVYNDFTSMFNAFSSGQLDFTDFPIQPGNASLCANPDVYCTSPTPANDIFELDINHFAQFLGVPLQTDRTQPTPTVASISSSAGACSTGFGQLTVHLLNRETGNTTILDSLNKLTISNQPSGSPFATVTDAGGSNPTGAYVFPCILAGTYKVSSSVYGSNTPCTSNIPTSCVMIGSGQSVISNFLVDWNSPSTKQPTQAGVYVPRALAHLLDKPSFIAGQFGSSATDEEEMLNANMGVSNLFSNTAECADHPWFNPCNPVSAYNLVSDDIAGGSEWWTAFGNGSFPAVGKVGPGYSGVADLRAACDDFVKSGFTVVNGANSTDCGDVALASLGTTVPSTYAHLSNNGKNIIFFVRTAFGRKQFGTILADTLDFLFGTPSSSGGGTVSFGEPPNPLPQYYTFNQVISCVFKDPTCWNLYTGGFFTGATPDELYNLFHSSFASSICGGPVSSFPNYGSYCDPAFDTWAADGEFTSSLAQASQFFARAAATGLTDGLNLPVYSDVASFAALNGWNFQQCTGAPCVSTQSSIVNTLGAGTGLGYWTLLNARQVPGYTPVNSGDAPGGGDPNLIRYGFGSFGLADLSPFEANSQEEVNVVSMIFDSMLQLNPLTGGGNAQLIDWQTTSHHSMFNPTLTCSSPATGLVIGCTVQTWHLRNDLYFQDGTPVTANDVAYTLLADRDVPSNNYQFNVANLASATGLDCGLGQPCKTLQVVLTQSSPFYELNIGTVPIIPEHIWAPICGPIVNNAIPSGSTSQCASFTFDPMAQGIMIGDGPWECVVPAGFPNAGHVGGSCTVVPCQGLCLGGQAVFGGGTIQLTRYQKFARCCPDDISSSLGKLSWADKNNNGVVDIQDLASVASCFGLGGGGSNAVCSSADSMYWACSLFPCTDIVCGCEVTIQTLATVAFYYGHGITYPYLPSQLTGLDPQIDPFFCSKTGC